MPRLPSSERSPLLSSTALGKRRVSPTADVAAPTPGGLLEDGVQLLEEDIAIEGMVLALLRELEDRGYSVPHGLVQLHDDLSLEEAEAEAAVFRTVFSVPRHRSVLDKYLPILPTSSPIELLDATSSNGTASARPPLPSPSPSTSHVSSAQTYPSNRPSPLSSQILDTSVITSPSALLLAALLSLLISLQAEVQGSTQEADRGVDGELRMFKARRELGERLYAVVGGLLDSYLLSGDQRDEDGEDALVTLLFHDYALNYDSIDRATCSLDLLLDLSSYPLVEAEHLVSHPVVLASTEYVWRNGLVPSPRRGDNQSLSWRESMVQLDRFSVPRILHTQTYILSTLHAAITVYILMFSSYAHFDALNPLTPDAPIRVGIPESGHPVKTWSVLTSLVWWLWVAGTLGWAGEVGRAWHHRGPHPSLPLSPSTLLPLIHHSLVLVSLVFRFCLLLSPRAPIIFLSTSLSMLAWSIPFLAASRILPQNLPAFGAPTHQRWEKIRDGRRRRDVGYRPPPKSVPQSHRALRSLEANLGGLVQFGSYFAVFGILLLWSLSGKLDYPSAFFLPYTLLTKPTTALSTGGTVSPIEARTTLAFTLILGVVLAYFSGGRPSVSGKVPSGGAGHRGLDDLDGWDRHGREVAFRARRERLAVTRYFAFVPPALHPSPDSVPSAFSTPPLPSPINLLIPPLLLASFVSRRLGSEESARSLGERGRLWAWRVGISPLGGWALLAKTIRSARGLE